MPKKPKCQGYEVFQRMNYLFQIRDFMATKIKNPAVSTYYGNLIVNIAKKSVLRIDPNLKRQICQRCRGPLLPGTSEVKMKKKHKVCVVQIRCPQCKFIKRYPISDKTKPWFQHPESVFETIDYGKVDNVSNYKEMPNKPTT